ncbi:MAG TPA: EFR1 family ferrodoxin [Anaerovoracaceae bacterium]|nr:EFR1 family ferrodoxin [Anaerovoracaceae bacterium]
MIFYFTGTGNSLYAAGKIAEAQGDRMYSIARLMDQQKKAFHYNFNENELLGFVFPIYAWGPPGIVLDFISKLDVSGYPYVFSLNTCGDEEGKTPKVIRKALAAKGLALAGSFSIRMPNNYILEGFDVDPKDVEAEKLKAAELMLAEINTTIGQRKKNVYLTLPGKHATLKTTFANPMFNRFAMNTRHYSADDSCTRCGLCEQICPVHTIRITDKPVWGKACTYCMACINRCPVRAIQYGKGTAKKGRYSHPDLVRLENQVAE